MTQNRRIVLNVLATYGRSVFSVACGLFTSRWVLLSLGQTDYGLYGVVGGLTVFISFLNRLLASATIRFYAYSIGRAQSAENAKVGLEDCRSWFNTALMSHTVLPLLLIAIGYPIGMYFIRNYMTIPANRLADCIWVFRLAAITCFVSMVEVPFRAMYGAKQYIAELTIYRFSTTTLNVVFFYYMVTHPGVWLVKYALWICLMAVIPGIIISVRAVIIFPECHFGFRYWGQWNRLRQMWSYGGWTAFAGVGRICRGQGVALIVNENFGPRINASMAVANQVSGQTGCLASSMLGAFAPVITTACGAGDFEKMREFAFRVCKFGTLLSIILALPLILELDYIVKLWLKDPPPFASFLCLSMLVVLIVDNTSTGHMLAVNAMGKIAKYQSFLGTALILTLPLAWLLIYCQCGVYSIGFAFVIATMLSAWGRVYFARKLAGMSARYWLRHILGPMFFVIALTLSFGAIPSLFLDESFCRLALTVVVCELTLIPLAWLMIFSDSERSFVLSKICERLSRCETVCGWLKRICK